VSFSLPEEAQHSHVAPANVEMKQDANNKWSIIWMQNNYKSESESSEFCIYFMYAVMGKTINSRTTVKLYSNGVHLKGKIIHC